MAWNEESVPLPAASPFPCAAAVLHVPSGFGVMAVKGRVNSLTPVLFEQLTCALTGGSKSMTAKSCENTGVTRLAGSSAPLLLGFWKNRPWTVPIVTSPAAAACCGKGATETRGRAGRAARTRESTSPATRPRSAVRTDRDNQGLGPFGQDRYRTQPARIVDFGICFPPRWTDVGRALYLAEFEGAFVPCLPAALVYKCSPDHKCGNRPVKVTLRRIQRF